MTLLSPYGAHVTQRDIVIALYSVSTVALPAITLVYAVLVAMTIWNYLYSARSVGLMHTLPIDRRGLFLTNVLSGFAMLLLPYAIAGGLGIVITLLFGIFPGLAVLQTVAAVVGLSAFYFGTATFCAMITGHLIALPVFYFIGHFLAVALEFLVATFSTNFIFGYTGPSSLSLDFLSPTVYIYRRFIAEYHFDEALMQGSYTLEGLWVVGVYALVGLALLLAAYALYRVRRSECAGDVVAYRCLKPIFRYGVALCTALTGGQLLYEIVWHPTFQTGNYYQMLPMAVCMIAAGLVGYFVASMLLEKTPRVFRRSWPGMLTVAAMVVILCGCVSFDLFHIAGRLPAGSDIESVSLTAYGETYVSVDGDDPLAEQVLALHSRVISSESYVRSMDRRQGAPERDTDYTTVTFRYVLSNGETMIRRYYLPFTRERWDTDSASYDYAFNHLVNSGEAALSRVTIPTDGELTEIWANLYYTEGIWEDLSPDLTNRELEQIYQALLKDAAAGNLPKVGFSADPAENYLGELQLEYRAPDPEQAVDYNYHYCYVELTDAMTHTLRAMEAAGYPSLEELQAAMVAELT